MPKIASEGTISPFIHSIAEPFVGALLVACPFIFGYSDVGAATAISAIAGILLIVLSLATDWAIAVIKLVPLRVHAIVDAVVGVVFFVSPFLFGFTGTGSATAIFLALGITWILLALGTRWEPKSVGPRLDKQP